MQNEKVLQEEIEFKQASLIDRVELLISEMNTKQIDREALVQALVLSLFSLKHIFLIGEPGVSKTGILEIFSSCVSDGKVFDICIKSDTKYEEIFGESYRDESGKFHYDPTNSITESYIAILDEIWKGNSKTMNSLLSIMSGYRKIDIMGEGTRRVPLLSVTAASNELPIDKEVRPLRDRFLFSMRVQKINNEDDWLKFISREYDRDPQLQNTFTRDEILFLSDAAKKITIPLEIKKLLYSIRQKVVLLEIGVSERKFDQVVDTFMTSALLNRRDKVNYSELFMLQHVLWDKESDIQLVTKILNDEIFGQIDVVKKYINDLNSEYKKIDSIIRGQLDDFLKNRRTIEYDDLAYFDTNIAYMQRVTTALDDIINGVNVLKSGYNFSMNVERELKENILAMEWKSPIFEVIEYSQYKDMGDRFLSKKLEIEEWLQKNNELHLYNTNATQIRI